MIPISPLLGEGEQILCNSYWLIKTFPSEQEEQFKCPHVVLLQNSLQILNSMYSELKLFLFKTKPIPATNKKSPKKMKQNYFETKPRAFLLEFESFCFVFSGTKVWHKTMKAFLS